MLTTSRPKKVYPKVTESQIHNAFRDVSRYESFLLEDVGIVVSNTSEGRDADATQRGVIGLADGTHVTYLFGKASSVSRYRLAEGGRKSLIPSKQILTRNMPVTFSRHKKNPSWVFKVVAWEPEVFEDLIGGQDIYRLVECSAQFGTLYRASHSPPKTLRTVWEGANLESLRSKYPQNLWPVRDHGSKPIHFEKREAGAWKLCSDPR
jgi:hypothetical protein